MVAVGVVIMFDRTGQARPADLCVRGRGGARGRPNSHRRHQPELDQIFVENAVSLSAAQALCATPICTRHWRHKRQAASK
jgi:hypothetical protein